MSNFGLRNSGKKITSSSATLTTKRIYTLFLSLWIPFFETLKDYWLFWLFNLQLVRLHKSRNIWDILNLDNNARYDLFTLILICFGCRKLLSMWYNRKIVQIITYHICSLLVYLPSCLGRRQRSDLFCLRVKLPPVTTSLTTQEYK